MPFVADQGKEALNFQISVIAAIKANNGERYRYPFALRLIK